MSSINCNVNNCGHNDSGICYANKISINGKKSHTSTHTCCNTFVEESNESFTNNIDNSSNNTMIGCNVKTCVNNAGTVCVLSNIGVTTSAPITNAASETYCSSFKCK